MLKKYDWPPHALENQCILQCLGIIKYGVLSKLELVPKQIVAIKDPMYYTRLDSGFHVYT